MTKERSVAVLSLGKMGYALARRFLDSGYHTTVWNRDAKKAAPLIENGATRAGDAAAAVEASSVIVVCLLDDVVARNALEPTRKALSGRTVINLTSETPNQAREFASWIEETGARYVSGGIMATPDIIGTQYSMILYSGHESTFSENRELLETLGKAEFFGSDPGAAALHDIALLSAMYGMLAGVLQGMALVKSADRTAASIVPLLEVFLQAMLPSIPEYASRIDSGDHASNVGSPLSMQTNGFDLFLRATEEQGVRTDLLAGPGRLMREAVRAGHGDREMTAVHELLWRKV